MRRVLDGVLAFVAACLVMASCSSRAAPAKDAGQCVVIVASPDAGALVLPNPGF